MKKYHLAIWTPLPPIPSGISDYSAELIQSLLPLGFEILCYSNPEVDKANFLDKGIQVHSYNEYIQGAFPIDLHIYHIGNHVFHREIYLQALREPGLVVLHDTSLTDLVVEINKEGIMDNLEINFKDEVIHSLINNQNILYYIPQLRKNYPLVSNLISRSKAVVVHNSSAVMKLQNEYPPVPVYYSPLGVRTKELIRDVGIKKNFGYSQADKIIGCFGILSRNKRLHTILDSISRLIKENGNIRLLIAGRASADTIYIQELNNLINDLRLKDHVRIITDLPFEDFKNWISAVDLIINLRHPTAGETSAILFEALASSTPIILSKLTQYTDFCWIPQIPIGPNENALLEYQIIRILADQEYSELLVSQGHRFISDVASMDNVAKQHLRIINRILSDSTDDLNHPIQKETLQGVRIITDLGIDDLYSKWARDLINVLNEGGVPVLYHEWIWDILIARADSGFVPGNGILEPCINLIVSCTKGYKKLQPFLQDYYKDCYNIVCSQGFEIFQSNNSGSIFRNINEVWVFGQEEQSFQSQIEIPVWLKIRTFGELPYTGEKILANLSRIKSNKEFKDTNTLGLEKKSYYQKKETSGKRNEVGLNCEEQYELDNNIVDELLMEIIKEIRGLEVLRGSRTSTKFEDKGKLFYISRVKRCLKRVINSGKIIEALIKVFYRLIYSLFEVNKKYMELIKRLEKLEEEKNNQSKEG